MFTKLKQLYGRWIVLGKKIAAFQIRAIFTLTYFIFIIPLGMIVKFFYSIDKPGWRQVRAEEETAVESARRQF